MISRCVLYRISLGFFITDNFHFRTVRLRSVAFWQTVPRCKQQRTYPSDKSLQDHYIFLQEVIVCPWPHCVTSHYFFAFLPLVVSVIPES